MRIENIAETMIPLLPWKFLPTQFSFDQTTVVLLEKGSHLVKKISSVS